MMESIALTESHMVIDTAPAAEEDYVVVQDEDMLVEDIGDDSSYDMCDEEDGLMAGLFRSLSPVPSISAQEFQDLDTLLEEKDTNGSIGASIVSIAGDGGDGDDDDSNSKEDDYCRDDANDGAPALLSDLEGSDEDVASKQKGATKKSPSSSPPSDEDLRKAEQHEAVANKTLKSRPSNKKRRKKIKMMKKAAAAATAAAALSEMNSTMSSAAAAASTVSPPRQHNKIKSATTKSLSSRKTNNQVAIATETLARFRAEHGL
mmetsp:Transcript_5144/g.9872  ORF Transcript_5144/g.9872 Transcript_5144/m.9872 type:complete len:261 (-) Transcript_5144:717-1499(-)